MNTKTNETSIVQIFENAATKQQKDFIKLQDHCTLCNSTLEIHHICELEQDMIREEAFCPCCDVRTRNRVYLLN